MLGGGIESGAEFFHQHLGKTADVPQGRPQVMRDRVTESLQLFVGGFQLGRPLDHPMFELVIEFQDFPLIRFPLGNVAEGHHSAMHYAILASERTAAGLDPGTFGDLWTAEKYLSGARLSVNRAHQGKSLRGKESDSVGQVAAIMFGPLVCGNVRWAVAHDPLRRPIPYQELSLLVRRDQPLGHVVQHRLQHE